VPRFKTASPAATLASAAASRGVAPANSAALKAAATVSPTISMHATQAGIILGTAAYMSPEQARGRMVDKRADIWAFGVVLFEMLTGRRAFESDDVSMTLAVVMTQEPDWSALPSSTPPALRRALRRCLKKDPRERARDVGDVRLDLENHHNYAWKEIHRRPDGSTAELIVHPQLMVRRDVSGALREVLHPIAATLPIDKPRVPGSGDEYDS